jgi:hypothetical protein
MLGRKLACFAARSGKRLIIVLAERSRRPTENIANGGSRSPGKIAQPEGRIARGRIRQIAKGVRRRCLLLRIETMQIVIRHCRHLRRSSPASRSIPLALL